MIFLYDPKFRKKKRKFRSRNCFLNENIGPATADKSSGFRRLTRDSRVSVVSLEIPGIVVSLEIRVFRSFSCKNQFSYRKIDPWQPGEAVRTQGNPKKQPKKKVNSENL